MGPLKHGGLALALSIASSVQFFILIFLLKRKGSLIYIKPIIMASVKSVVAATLMGIGVYGCFIRWLSADPGAGPFRMGIHLAALMVIGMIIYFGIARILGCEEIRSIQQMLWRKTRGKRRSAA